MKKNSILSYHFIVLFLLTFHHSSKLFLSPLAIRRMQDTTSAAFSICAVIDEGVVIQERRHNVSFPYISGIYLYSNGDDRRDNGDKEESKPEPEAAPEEPREQEQVQEVEHTGNRIRADDRTDDEFGRYRDPIRPPDTHYFPRVGRRSLGNTLLSEPCLILTTLSVIYMNE